MSYKIFVDDNFHYMDEEHRYFLGEFDTPEAAIAACQRVVNQWLKETYESGMSSAELLTKYALFGEDPFVMDREVKFSAREYASEQVEKIIREES